MINQHVGTVVITNQAIKSLRREGKSDRLYLAAYLAAGNTLNVGQPVAMFFDRKRKSVLHVTIEGMESTEKKFVLAEELFGDVVARILNGDSSIPTPAIAAIALQDNDLSEALHVLVCDMLPGILSTRGEEIYEALLAIDSAAGTLLV